MSEDITHVLAGWDFQPDEINVRLVEGDDGRTKIQLRLDLGLLQMEQDGRPDGQRPHDCDSLLDYFVEQQREHDAAHPDEKPFQLDGEQCAQLLREGIQYYHRYISFWHLERYDLCARDTGRNLRLLKFVRDHARRDQDRLQFDQWRPYITMMHARSLATPLIEDEKYDEALTAIDAAIAGIKRFLEEYQQTHRAEQCGELVMLLKWRKELLEQSRSKGGDGRPRDPINSLRAELEEAVADERYEDAARLRDQLRRLKGPGPTGENL